MTARRLLRAGRVFLVTFGGSLLVASIVGCVLAGVIAALVQVGFSHVAATVGAWSVLILLTVAIVRAWLEA